MNEIPEGDDGLGGPRWMKGYDILICALFLYMISILPARIDKTVLLVLCFWFLAPVWCLVLSGLFFFIALFFGCVYGLGVVFGG